MPHKKLKKYVSDARKSGIHDKQIEKNLLHVGWHPEHVQKAFLHHDEKNPKQETHHKHDGKTWILTGLFMVLFALILTSTSFFYKFISPIGIQKPELQSPAPFTQKEINQDTIKQVKIDEDFIAYSANEIGAYKLHNDPRTGEPARIEFVISDINKVYTVRIKDNVPVAYEGRVDNPDIRLTMDKLTFLKMVTSQNFDQEIATAVSQGKVTVEVLASEVTVGLKGYKAIYDAIVKESGLPTGEVVAAFDENLLWR